MRRPTSPFLLLLLGSAVTVLIAEWLRFQVGSALGALPLGAGAVLTVAAVARAFRGRRAWRAEQERLAEAAAHAAAAEVAAATRRAEESRRADRSAGRRAPRSVPSPAPPLLDASELLPGLEAREPPEPRLGTPRGDVPSEGSEATREGEEAAVSFTRNRSAAHSASTEED